MSYETSSSKQHLMFTVFLKQQKTPIWIGKLFSFVWQLNQNQNKYIALHYKSYIFYQFKLYQWLMQNGCQRNVGEYFPTSMQKC